MVAIKQFKTGEGKVFASAFSQTEQSLLMNVYKGRAPSKEDFSNVIKFSLMQTKKEKLSYWLNDISQVSQDTLPDVQPLIDQLVGKLKGSNLKKFSLISHRPLEERRRLEAALSKSGVECKTFSSFENASEWLLVPEIDANVWEQSPELSF